MVRVSNRSSEGCEFDPCLGLRNNFLSIDLEDHSSTLDLNNTFIISFNVESPFTNIPLQETIDIAVNLIFNDSPNFPVNRKDLKQLFLFATSQTHFLFHGLFYDQVNGVAMGSPLVPVLANLFMGYHEQLWVENYD